MLTLADHLAAVEARRFVGREAELARLSVLCDPDSPIRIGFVHGPGGIGKSVLLGAFGRDAEGVADLRRIDGRLIDPTPGTLERAIGDLGDAELPILVIDSFESIENLSGFLRTDVLPSLPVATRLLVASRRPPAPGWRRDGWGPVMAEIELGPLSREETRALLARENVEDPGRVEQLASWSRGEPLAISLAAEALRSDPNLDADRLDSDERIADALIRHMGAADELDRALLTAAVARSVDPRLLEDVLGPGQGEEAYERLSGLSFCEPYGGRITLHERLRSAVKARDAATVRTVRARIADHLDRRIRGGEPEFIDELTALIDDPVVRWGIDGGEAHRADVPRPGDLERAAELAGDDRDPRLWPWVERFFEESPDRVVVARDDLGQMLGFTIAVTPANAAGWVAEDPWLGPWLADCVDLPDGGQTILWRDTLAAPATADEGRSSLVALLNAAAAGTSGLVNPRYFYGPVDPRDEAAVALSQSIGADHLPRLDVRATRRIECHRLDHGPGGMLSTIRQLVARDSGGLGAASPDETETVAAVRLALRQFHNPSALAGNPLARGPRDARAQRLQAEIREVVDGSFGESAQERLLRDTLLRGYLDPDANHDAATHALHLSRSTYFRRLREATDRVAARFPLSH